MKKVIYKEAKTYTEALINGAGVIQQTTNFGMFKSLEFNRGLDNGIEPKRLKEFINLYEKGEYFTDIVHLFVNLTLTVIDGSHKLKMHELFNLPINFTILTQKEFNEGTDIEILGAVSRFNAKSSKWDGSGNYNAALKCKEPLALTIADIKGKYDNKFGFKKNLLTASRIYALVSKDEKGLASVSKSVEDYCKRELLDVIISDDFQKEFEFVCNVLHCVVAHNRIYKNKFDLTPFYFIRHIMPMVWNNELNMNKFYHNLLKRGLLDIGNTLSGIGLAVNEIANMKIKKTEEIIEIV